MGKSKKRTLGKITGKDFEILKRTDVIDRILNDIRNDCINEETVKHICFFGIKTEDLTEAGAAYEELNAVKRFLF